MKNIFAVIFAVGLGTLGSTALQAQCQGNPPICGNTATGAGALASVTSGGADSAFGAQALTANNSGQYNTAVGFRAAENNTSGAGNTVVGGDAFSSNISGNNNVAIGLSALAGTNGGSSGSDNVGIGFDALYSESTGSFNVASGTDALYLDNSGGFNAATGYLALYNNTTGSFNVGLGYGAGYYNPASANWNIDIGNYGSSSDPGGIIRIGTVGIHSALYAAGVYGAQVSDAVPVYINNVGQLGVVNSSIRYKEDVHDMADASSRIFELRPVTYRYKQAYADGSKPMDYGLIAEEVARVYPDLVVRNANGEIQTVQYQKLTPMLLNEVQKQHRLLEQMEKTVAQQQEAIQTLKAEQAETVLSLEKRLAALEQMLPSAKTLESRLETK